jgi:hypothetical protein
MMRTWNAKGSGRLPAAFTDFPKEIKDIIYFYEEDAGSFTRGFPRMLAALEVMQANYALTDGMAAVLHGGEPFTRLNRILFDEHSWRKVRKRSDLGFRASQDGGGGWWLDEKRTDGTALMMSVSFHPLRGIREQLYGLWVVNLPWLILSHLCRWVDEDYRNEAESLIQARDLDESFTQHLPSSFHYRFLESVHRVREQGLKKRIHADKE